MVGVSLRVKSGGDVGTIESLRVKVGAFVRRDREIVRSRHRRMSNPNSPRDEDCDEVSGECRFQRRGALSDAGAMRAESEAGRTDRSVRG